MISGDVKKFIFLFICIEISSEPWRMVIRISKCYSLFFSGLSVSLFLLQNYNFLSKKLYFHIFYFILFFKFIIIHIHLQLIYVLFFMLFYHTNIFFFLCALCLCICMFIFVSIWGELVNQIHFWMLILLNFSLTFKDIEKECSVINIYRQNQPRDIRSVNFKNLSLNHLPKKVHNSPGSPLVVCAVSFISFFVFHHRK